MKHAHKAKGSFRNELAKRVIRWGGCTIILGATLFVGQETQAQSLPNYYYVWCGCPQGSYINSATGIQMPGRVTNPNFALATPQPGINLRQHTQAFHVHKVQIGARRWSGRQTKYALINGKLVHPNRVVAQHNGVGRIMPRLSTRVRRGGCRQSAVTRAGLVCVELDVNPVGPLGRQAPLGVPRTPWEIRVATARGYQILADIRVLAAERRFRFIEPDYVIPCSVTPRDKAFVDGQLWGLHNPKRKTGKSKADIDAIRAWNLSIGSSDVVVAVIDTGVRYTHQDLRNQMWVNADEVANNGKDDDNDGFVDNIYGMDAVNDDGDPMDDNGHGTHCAGTIGAEANNGHPHVGVAWKVRLMACKSISGMGTGTTSDAVKCIDWAVTNGAQVLSLSWGHSDESNALYSALKKAREKGVVVVAAAGNEGTNTDKSPHYPSGYELDNIISVAAINQNGRLTSWSNYGARSVDLAAPGDDIYSTSAESDSGYVALSGTSMACPHVSGVAALMLAQNPKATPSEMRVKLIRAVTPSTNLKGRTVSGGWVNAFNALALAKQGPGSLSRRPFRRFSR
jgi:subtilisin family serine protease